MADNVIKMEEEFAKKANEIYEDNNQALKNNLTGATDMIGKILGGQDAESILSNLMTLNDSDFALISELMLDQLERSLKDPTATLQIAQVMNANGQKVEEVIMGLKAFIFNVDKMEEFKEYSQRKRDFVKRLFLIYVNAFSEIEGIAKKTITIPIQLISEDAKIPEYARAGDAGLDVFAVEDVDILPGQTIVAKTGIKVAIPRGYELQVRPKSGRSAKSKLRVANTPGTIDSGYRDEVGIILENIEPAITDIAYDFDENGRPVIASIAHGSTIHIAKGEKIAQLVLSEVNTAAFEAVSEIENIGENRGGGFGSTGLK